MFPFLLFGVYAAPAQQADSLRTFRIALLVPEGTQTQRLAESTRIFLEGRLNQPLKAKGFALQIINVPMPLLPAEAQRRVADLKEQGFDGALSLLSGPENTVFVKMANLPFPILLTWSEEVPIPTGKASFLFGIDFEETFRPIAWTLWAKKQALPSWDFYSETHDDRLNRLAKRTETEFTGSGISVHSVRFLRNAPEPYREYFSSSSPGLERPSLVWLAKGQAEAISETLASRTGKASVICLGDESPLLPSSGKFRYLTQDPNGGDRFAKARLAAVWLADAILGEENPPRDPRKLARALERIQHIKGAGEEIWLCPEKHRPVKKAVFFLRPRGGSLEITERMLLEKRGERFVPFNGR